MIKLKMTKSTASFICFIMMFSLLQSCEMDDKSFDADLNLQAPNGELIADNMSSFKEEVSFVIENIYGERKEFEIVKLKFAQGITQGYLADIEYETYDGLKGGYFKVHGLGEYRLSTSGMLIMSKIRLKSDSESGGTGGGNNYSYHCKKSSNNLCNACDKKVYNVPGGQQITCLCKDGLAEGCDLYEITW